MDALRISLLVIGGIIILAIYLYGRRTLQFENRNLDLPRRSLWLRWYRQLTERFRRTQMPPDREAPVVSPDVIASEELDSLGEIIPRRDAEVGEVDDVSMIVELTSEQIAPAGEQLFIALTILGADDHKLTGESIVQAAEQQGFHLTPDLIYHYDVDDAQGYRQALLGLANILEPGTFDSEHMRTFATPGLVLYLHLPAPLEARQAFDRLIEVGQGLAAQLNADLCDETRSVLTKQTIGHMKEKVEAFRFRQKMAQIQRQRQ